MAKALTQFILNRNFILVLAVFLGMWKGDYAAFIKDYTFYILAIVMTFSMTGIQTHSLFPLQRNIKPMLVGTFLNYIVFGVVIIAVAYWLMPSEKLFIGFVVIAATPPGVAVIPFSHILGGDVKYSIIGVLGAFIASVFLAPAIVGFFAQVEGEGINSFQLFVNMVKLVVLPLLFSRVLLWKPIQAGIVKVRGSVVDWGFAIIIFTAVGVNRQVFFSNFEVLLLSSVVLFIGTFGIGSLYELFVRKMGVREDVGTTQNLLLTIKSSGFSVVTALSLFGTEAAIPSAVMALFVLMYLLFLSFRKEYRNYKLKKQTI
ncbi:MAG: bile acid:sodium symporter family protein [Marinifilaceae bacterium]